MNELYYFYILIKSVTLCIPFFLTYLMHIFDVQLETVKNEMKCRVC